MCVFDEIYDDGVEYGIEQGIEQGIRTLIKFSYDNNLDSDIIKNALIDSYNLSEEKAEYYIDEYTKSATT